ncbi:MAG: winged helix-turn-helix domain-containing protein [Candidatus Hodarchaeota archaeon]
MSRNNKDPRKLNNKTQLLIFILRGSNRRKIYNLLLKGPRPIASISALTNIQLSNVSRVIKDFKKNGLVETTNPKYFRGGFYRLTPLALELRSEFEEHTKFYLGK